MDKHHDCDFTLQMTPVQVLHQKSRTNTQIATAWLSL